MYIFKYLENSIIQIKLKCNKKILRKLTLMSVFNEKKIKIYDIFFKTNKGRIK